MISLISFSWPAGQKQLNKLAEALRTLVAAGFLCNSCVLSHTHLCFKFIATSSGTGIVCTTSFLTVSNGFNLFLTWQEISSLGCGLYC